MNESTHPHLIRCLFVEDNFDDIEIVRHRLNGLCVLDAARTRAEFMSALEKPWDIILTDLAISGDHFSGHDAIRLAKGAMPATPILVVTGSVDEDSAALACQQGACDYVLKHSLIRLRMAISNAHEAAQSRREIEAQKQQQLRNDRLEILGHLSTGISHDLNNVLGVILAGTELIRQKMNPMDTRIVDAMESSAKRGADMVKQILLFARGSNGSIYKPVAVDYLLGEVRSVLSSEAFPNIRTTTHVVPGTSKVLCDATQLHQVLMNLALNSRAVMPRGGEIHISAQNVSHVDGEAFAINGDFICIAVSDTGPGIPDEALPHIFEAFFSTKPVGVGSGMGLAIVKSIIESHGGVIQVKSTKAGATFSIYLPAGNDNHGKDTTSFDGKGMTVLVVEDEETMRLFIQLHLESAGYKVISAANGPEALAQFRVGQQIDVLLTDLSLPIMNGNEITRNLRAMNLDLPVVYISARDTTLPTEPEPNAIIQKPFTRQILLTTLRDVVAKSETLSQIGNR